MTKECLGESKANASGEEGSNRRTLKSEPSSSPKRSRKDLKAYTVGILTHLLNLAVPGQSL